MKGGKTSRFGKGGLSDKRRARSRSPVPRGPDCDRRRRGASVEEVDDDCDLVMGNTDNPRLVRLASVCGEMLAARLIEPSLSAHYASNLTFPAKKDVEGGYTDRRMCMDLRAVNDATEFDRYNMPHPDVALAVILGSKVFSILDLRSGYHQIPILEIDRDKTSFWWGPKLYRYSRMVMG